MTALSDTKCHMAVDRDGEYQPCNRPAVAMIEDREFGEDFPVCQEHLTPTPGPPASQQDIFGGEVG